MERLLRPELPKYWGKEAFGVAAPMAWISVGIVFGNGDFDDVKIFICWVQTNIENPGHSKILEPKAVF